MEPVDLVQMYIYQSKELNWLHFNNETRVQERQQVRDQQSCISIFVVYPTILSSNKEHQSRHDNSIHAWLCGRFIETKTSGERNFIKRSKALFFLATVLAIEICKSPNPISKRKSTSDDFLSRTDPSIFTSIAPVLWEQSN